MSYLPPSISYKSFTCPHCGVLARQYKWGYTLNQANGDYYVEGNVERAPLQITSCENCGQNCV